MVKTVSLMCLLLTLAPLSVGAIKPADGMCPHGNLHFYGAENPDGDSEFIDLVEDGTDSWVVGYTKDSQLNGGVSSAPIMAHYSSLGDDLRLSWSYYYRVDGRDAFVRATFNSSKDRIVVIAEDLDKSENPVLALLNLDGSVASTSVLVLPSNNPAKAAFSFRHVTGSAALYDGNFGSLTCFVHSVNEA